MVTPPRGSLREVMILFTRLGFTAFGGPAAHIAQMQDEVVEKRKWLDRGHFMDMLGATQFIPGPNSTEMAIHIGYLQQGVRGLIVAGVSFIWPAFLIVLALSYLYVRFGSLPDAGGLFYGIQPVVVAIVAVATVRLARISCRTPFAMTLAVAAALLVLADWLGALWVIVLGGLIGVAYERLRRHDVAALLLAVLSAPTATLAGEAATSVSARSPSLGGLFLYFLTVGATIMGSGYVIVSYLNDGLVNRLGWLTQSQLVDAIAVGQMTPGPVFTTAAFVGYVVMAGSNNNVYAGAAGALVSTIAIFLPAFVFVWLLSPWVQRVRTSRALRAFLDGVNAAVVGTVAATTFFLLISATVNLTIPVYAISVGAYAVDLPAAAITVVSLVILLRRPRLNSTWLIAAGALAGLLLQLITS